ncbi:MAG: hypothetical protein ACOVLC_14645 [Flavobacterium sp.]
MRYIFSNLFIASCFIMLFSSCEDETTVFNVDGGVNDTYFHFLQANAEFGASPIDFVYDVNVGVTTRSSVARSYSVSVNPELTTIASNGYSIDASGLSIAPNSFNDDFQVSFNFDAIPSSGSVVLALDISTAAGSVMPDKSTILITVSRSCPLGTQSIAGNHTYNSFDLVRGQSANPNCDSTPTGTVTWTQVGTTPGLYTTTDMAFGMYQNCWNVAAGAVSASSRVRWVCNQISALGTDQFGDGFTYTVTSVSGPNMSISWTNAYGDSGKVIITREGGANWPDLLQD